jgi:hypothetical protein
VYVEIRSTKLPKPERWTAVFEPLELFPLLDELVIAIRRIPFLRRQGSCQWHGSVEKLKRGPEHLSTIMIVDGQAHMEAEYEGLDLNMDVMLKKKCKCLPDTPLMDLTDVKRKREKKQMPYREARQAALEQRVGEATCKN